MPAIFKFAFALALVLVAGGLAGLSSRTTPDLPAAEAAVPTDAVVSDDATSATGRRQTPHP